METIKQTYKIKAPVEKVWKALVDPKIIEDWGGGPVEMSDEVGFNFKLWGGDIYGKNLEVVPNKKLVQDWYGGDWEKPSKATFKLSSNKGVTLLELIHESLPEGEVSDFDDGWKSYYLGPLKELLERQV